MFRIRLNSNSPSQIENEVMTQIQNRNQRSQTKDRHSEMSKKSNFSVSSVYSPMRVHSGALYKSNSLRSTPVQHRHGKN